MHSVIAVIQNPLRSCILTRDIFCLCNRFSELDEAHLCSYVQATRRLTSNSKDARTYWTLCTESIFLLGKNYYIVFFITEFLILRHVLFLFSKWIAKWFMYYINLRMMCSFLWLLRSLVFLACSVTLTSRCIESTRVNKSMVATERTHPNLDHLSIPRDSKCVFIIDRIAFDSRFPRHIKTIYSCSGVCSVQQIGWYRL